VLIEISSTVRDGDYLWLYLTDNTGIWLDVQLIIGEEEVTEVESDSIADASDFDDAYYAAMEVFYRLDHHQMIYMEEWFEMGLQQLTIWVEAGEEFGVVFITDVYGAFEPTVETTDDADTPLLIESANYYLADTEYDSYVQFNAWEVDMFTEVTEASVAYTFVFDDEDKSDEEFTINIAREESESEADWEITNIEDLIDTYYDLDHPFYIGVDDDWFFDGSEGYAYGRAGDELGFLFYSERQNLEVTLEFTEGNTLLYEAGTTANAISSEDGFYYWYRSIAVTENADETDSSVTFRIKDMSFGSNLDLEYTVAFYLDDWDSDEYYAYAFDYSDYAYYEEYSDYEYGINNMNELEEAVDSMDHFYVVSIDDLQSDEELMIYPEAGQIIGILFFSQDSDLEIDFDELFLHDEDTRAFLYPTAEFAWDLEEHEVYYWFVSYAVDRNADEGENQILFFETGGDQFDFIITFSFGNMLATDDIQDMEGWEEFEEDVVEDIAVEEDLEDIIDDWYDGCFDTNQGQRDSAGDDCTWYEDYTDFCGFYDTESFSANSMCCVCQYFAGSVDLGDIYRDCEDTAGDARDSYNDGCEWYNEFPEGCGYYNDDDFDAVAMCCACADFEEAVYYTYEEDFEGAEYVDDDLIADYEDE
jgi:hypothetical protein